MAAAWATLGVLLLTLLGTAALAAGDRLRRLLSNNWAGRE